jgi:two-component sensor histidine kinase/putative methionine-R-sulfoxide reductase with GAF domain
MRSKITAMFGFFFSHWRRPLDEGIHMVKKGFSYCVETGDLVFAGYSSCTLVIYMLAQGKNIDELLKETQIYQEFVTRAKDQFSIDWHALKNQFIKSLKGQINDKCSLSDEGFDEERTVQGFREQHNANLLFHYFTWKGLVLYLNNELEEAYRIFNEAIQYTHGVALLPSVGDHLFYHSLVMTSLCLVQSGHEHLEIRRALNKNRKKLKKWMTNSPATFSHKYLLVEAESSRIKGRQQSAIDLYSRAIVSAREHGFVQVEALANELMARFHVSFNRKPVGQVYIQEACKCYHKWGAASKVRDLSEAYGLLYSTEYPRFDSVQDKTGTPSGSSQQIDLTTVLRSSQAISEEIILDRLLQEIIHMAIKNAGARKGFLILENEGRLFIEAEGYTGKDDSRLLQSIPLESSRKLSAGIVNYVKRTMEAVVLHNASEEGLFVSDPYVAENRSKSILCIPIVKQKKLTGILYLENDILTNAFTRERREVLSMLATQAAISLENAKLYEDVEHRVDQLQKAEKQIKASLEEKDVLLREIHHRVKNNMQIISSLLKLQSMQTKDKKDADMLRSSQKRIHAMSLIHEKLYESKDLSRVDFGHYTGELIQGLIRFHGVSSGKIKLEANIKNVFLGIDTAIPCGLIINELVTNSLKYAFPEDREGQIKIKINKTDEDEIELILSDNGIGVPDDLDIRNTKTLGLQLVTALAEHQLQGRIELDRTKGTEFRIRFREVKYEKRV